MVYTYVRNWLGAACFGATPVLLDHRRDSLSGIDGGLLDISPAGGILQAALEAADHHTDAEEGPAQLAEELDHRLDPEHLEQLHPQVLHGGEEVAQEPHHLAVEPVDEVVHHRGSHEIPNKYGLSPQIPMMVQI